MTTLINNNCSICREPMPEHPSESVDPAKAKIVLSCHHAFHSGCIVAWFKIKIQCPWLCPVDKSIREVVVEKGGERQTLVFEGLNCDHRVRELIHRINAMIFPESESSFIMMKVENSEVLPRPYWRQLNPDRTLFQEGVVPGTCPTFCFRL